jgi:GTP-binding protein HflX
LQEAREADLLLHVIDAADSERSERVEQVNEVLASIGADGVPQLEVYNKIDRTGDAARVEFAADGEPVRCWVSAHSGLGVPELLNALELRLGGGHLRVTLHVPASHGRARARLHRSGAVRAERVEADGSFAIDVTLRPHEIERICREEGLEVPASACVAPGRFLESRVHAIAGVDERP